MKNTDKEAWQDSTIVSVSLGSATKKMCANWKMYLGACVRIKKSQFYDIEGHKKPLMSYMV